MKTTIIVPEDILREFTVLCIERYGLRRKNSIIVDLIRNWIANERSKDGGIKTKSKIVKKPIEVPAIQVKKE